MNPTERDAFDKRVKELARKPVSPVVLETDDWNNIFTTDDRVADEEIEQAKAYYLAQKRHDVSSGSPSKQ